MPVITQIPIDPPAVLPTVPQILDKNQTSVVVDTKHTPISSLVTNIEGMPWTIDYYSQQLTTSSAPEGQDVGKSAEYQQYTLIKGAEIKVSADLNTAQDPESKSMNVLGSAFVHSYVIPNKGDMFVADVTGPGDMGYKRDAVFEVIASEQRSMFSQTVYFIEYKLVYVAHAQPTRFSDLQRKVVRTLHYLRDMLYNGQKPTVTDTEYNNITSLYSGYDFLLDMYLQWFVSLEYRAILMPGQSTRVYDHFVASVIPKITNVSDHVKLLKVDLFNVDDDYYLSAPSLYSALALKDIRSLKGCSKKMGLLSTTAFSNNAQNYGIRFSGVPLIVYPKDKDIIDDSRNNKLSAKTLSTATLLPVGGSDGTSYANLEYKTLFIGNTQTRYIKPVLYDDYYVLSHDFYNDTNAQSVLEVMTRNYLENKANNVEHLKLLVDDAVNWGGLERFYYIPILLMLIRGVIRRV